MNKTSKTLYIPLYGKAFVTKRGIILTDEKAAEIWKKEHFALRGKAKSKWLAFYMAMRAAVIDRWTKEKLAGRENAVVLHLGCGLDSRVLRVEHNCPWYDVDLPEVIEVRERYYTADENYHMVGADVTEAEWVDSIEQEKNAVVVMEGLSMYLPIDKIVALIESLQRHFENVDLIVDVYTSAAIEASKVANPIKNVGASAQTGIDTPETLENNLGIRFVAELSMTPDEYIRQLRFSERRFFKKMFAGDFAQSLYRLYTYEII